jgi:hypothetical protein
MTLPQCWSRRPPVLAALLAGVLGLRWARWPAHDAGDLAAQYACTDFVRHHPRSAYNLSWCGGIHPASYSVLSPYLMAWISVRTTGVLAGVGCAALGGLALTRSGVRRPMLPSLWLAVTVWANLAAGRVTYLLGMVFAVATVVLTGAGAGPRRRAVLAALLGVVATSCSPVAGLFVEVLAAALFLAGRRRRAWLLAAGPPVAIVVTSLLFPFSGIQPFPWYAALLTIGTAVTVAVLTPESWRTVRGGAGVYAGSAAPAVLNATPERSRSTAPPADSDAPMTCHRGIAAHRPRHAALRHLDPRRATPSAAITPSEQQCSCQRSRALPPRQPRLLRLETSQRQTPRRHPRLPRPTPPRRHLGHAPRQSAVPAQPRDRPRRLTNDIGTTPKPWSVRVDLRALLRAVRNRLGVTGTRRIVRCGE